MRRLSLKACLYLPLLAALSACTITGLDPAATKDLHWLGLKSHADMTADSRWQFAPDTRVRLTEVQPAADQLWLTAAEAGFYSIFIPPAEYAELELLINWPQGRTANDDTSGGWLLLPAASDPVDVELKLISLHNQRVVQSAQMRVDPSWFSASSQRPEQIREAFQRYAESLSSSR